jgi:hypothetical protein
METAPMTRTLVTSALPYINGVKHADIVHRYGPDSLVGRFIHRAQPQIHATVARVEYALSSQPK